MKPGRSNTYMQRFPPLPRPFQGSEKATVGELRPSEGERSIRVLKGDSGGFDTLLVTLHASIAEDAPWTRFLNALCDQLQGSSVTLVLRHPAQGDRGIMFDVNTVRPIVEIYRTGDFPDDPFRDLGDGEVSSIFDRLSRADLYRTRYYNELLKLDRIRDILAMNVDFGDGNIGSLMIARRDDAEDFGLLEKSLLIRLYPHLSIALRAYDRQRRDGLEKLAYIEAINQLAFGVVILNERGDIVRINETAHDLMAASGLLQVAEGRFRAIKPLDNARLNNLIAAKLASSAADSATTGSLKLICDDPERTLYLLLKPIHDSSANPEAAFGLAVYLSAGLMQRELVIDACATLHGFTRAEVALLTRLVDGDSIQAASATLGISEHTARTQLRSMFGKTGVHRQTELIRLVLTGLAIIA